MAKNRLILALGACHLVIPVMQLRAGYFSVLHSRPNIGVPQLLLEHPDAIGGIVFLDPSNGKGIP